MACAQKTALAHAVQQCVQSLQEVLAACCSSICSLTHVYDLLLVVLRYVELRGFIAGSKRVAVDTCKQLLTLWG